VFCTTLGRCLTSTKLFEETSLYSYIEKRVQRSEKWENKKDTWFEIEFLLKSRYQKHQCVLRADCASTVERTCLRGTEEQGTKAVYSQTVPRSLHFAMCCAAMRISSYFMSNRTLP
jgi:hypothetical protein